jgi:hypothetical protein
MIWSPDAETDVVAVDPDDDDLDLAADVDLLV